jgi:iron(III) transport system substrate-binding protein
MNRTTRWWALGIILVLALVLLFSNRRSVKDETVVIYVSEDQVFSEPILKDFEKETGIIVKPVFDTEEAKSTGAMNRLIAEKDNPQADVYWANEPVRAEVLKQRGIAAAYASPNAEGIPRHFKDPEGCWTGFSSRVRLLVVNKGVREKPASILAYTDPRWKGRGVITNPLFGTTTDQIAALFTIWGEDRAKTFMEEMKRNGVRISTNNGESADLVAAGHADFSLVDSDDGVNRIRQGNSIEMIYPDQGEGEMGCMVVPNAAVLIKGAPHPQNARKLIDYLLSKETERKLAFADCAQIPLHQDVDMPKDLKPISDIKTMQVDFSEVARKLIEIQPYLKSWVGY